MDLSIIIVNYNTRGLLRYCLKNILELNLRLRYEIIVVDNKSSDKSLMMLKELYGQQPCIKVVQAGTNLGYAGGNNLGIKKSCGKYLLIFNPDIKPLPNSIERLYDFMEAHFTAGMAGPKLINADGSLQYSCYRFPRFITPIYRRTPLGKFFFGQKEIKRYLMSDWEHKETSKVDWLLGSAVMVRKSFLEKVGLFDERFYLYFTDVDWARRFWLNDYEVYYLPDSVMIHLHRRESADIAWFSSLFSKISRIHIKDWLRYVFKYRNKSQSQDLNSKLI